MPLSRLMDWILGLVLVGGFLTLMYYLDQPNPLLTN